MYDIFLVGFISWLHRSRPKNEVSALSGNMYTKYTKRYRKKNIIRCSRAYINLRCTLSILFIMTLILVVICVILIFNIPSASWISKEPLNIVVVVTNDFVKNYFCNYWNKKHSRLHKKLHKKLPRFAQRFNQMLESNALLAIIIDFF